MVAVVDQVCVAALKICAPLLVGLGELQHEYPPVTNASVLPERTAAAREYSPVLIAGIACHVWVVGL
jgi:hypothetical protein